MTTYHFESIAVYAELGGAVRLARGARAFTTDPTTGAPVDATQGTRVAPYVDADAAGDVSFTAESWPVRLTNGATYEDVWPVDAVAGLATDEIMAAKVADPASLTQVAGNAVWAAVPPLGETLYVNASHGSDTNDGRSPGRAYATLQAAVDALAGPGTVVAAGGDYAPVTITADGVTIDGGNYRTTRILNAGTGSSVTIDAALYVTLRNIRVQGNASSAHGIEFVGAISAYVLIENCYITGHGGHGIYGGHSGHVNNVEIRASLIYNNLDGVNLQYGTGQINSVWVHHNDISWNSRNGVLFFGNNIVVEDNTVQANGAFAFALSDATLGGTKFCLASAIRNNYTEQNAYAVTGSAGIIGVFTGYKDDGLGSNKVLRALEVTGNYFGETGPTNAGGTYDAVILCEDLKLTTADDSQACVIRTRANFATVKMVALDGGLKSALTSSSVIDEMTTTLVPAAMVTALPAGVRYPSLSPVLSDTTYNATYLTGTWSVDAATNVLTSTVVHGLAVGAVVSFDAGAGALPGGIVAEPDFYYVESVPTSTTLTLKATRAGAQFDITSAGTAGWRIRPASIAATMIGLDFTVSPIVELTGVVSWPQRHTTGTTYLQLYAEPTSCRILLDDPNVFGADAYASLYSATAAKKHTKMAVRLRLTKIATALYAVQLDAGGLSSDNLNMSTSTAYSRNFRGTVTGADITSFRIAEGYTGALGNGSRIIAKRV